MSDIQMSNDRREQFEDPLQVIGFLRSCILSGEGLNQQDLAEINNFIQRWQAHAESVALGKDGHFHNTNGKWAAYSRKVCSTCKPPTDEEIDAMQSPSLEKAQGWISVSERLPKIDEYVLWVGESGCMCVTEIDKDDYPIDDPRSHIHGLTHWQPLPSPPNEEQERKR